MLIAAGLFTACNNTPKGDEAATTETQEVAAATGNDFTTDNATDGKVTAGSFTIDIKSLGLDEKEEMFQTKLKGHLLSPDFFDAEKFGTAKFEISSVEPYTAAAGAASVVEGANYTISGNLTLKDSTKNVSFPAAVTVSETEVTAKANFNIDRTQWGMSYGNDKSLKDKFISPEVNISLNIKAIK